MAHGVYRKRGFAAIGDYRGKDAEQEIWKLDAALLSQINATMKQAAIEEGQWSEKRELSSSLPISVIMATLNAGRDRNAAAKEEGEPWPPGGLPSPLPLGNPPPRCTLIASPEFRCTTRHDELP